MGRRIRRQVWSKDRHGGGGGGVTEHRDPSPKSTLSAFPLVAGREESISAPTQDQLLDTKPYLSNPPKDSSSCQCCLSQNHLPSASSCVIHISILICCIFFCVKKTPASLSRCYRI